MIRNTIELVINGEVAHTYNEYESIEGGELTPERIREQLLASVLGNYQTMNLPSGRAPRGPKEEAASLRRISLGSVLEVLRPLAIGVGMPLSVASSMEDAVYFACSALGVDPPRMHLCVEFRKDRHGTTSMRPRICIATQGVVEKTLGDAGIDSPRQFGAAELIPMTEYSASNPHEELRVASDPRDFFRGSR